MILLSDLRSCPAIFILSSMRGGKRGTILWHVMIEDIDSVGTPNDDEEDTPAEDDDIVEPKSKSELSVLALICPVLCLCIPPGDEEETENLTPSA